VTNELASSVGLAVPCNGDDVFVLPRLIKSLEGEVLPINTLSVSVSGCNSPPTLESSSFKVIVNHVRGERSASENRNVAADCLDDDILSFMDSDDLVSPYRTQALRVAPWSIIICRRPIHNIQNSYPFRLNQFALEWLTASPRGQFFQ
jgi:glycosyltransferase involved in cell wall biosynthesis